MGNKFFVQFQVSRPDGSDDYLKALVRQAVPQAEDLTVLERWGGRALVGFRVRPSSVASIKEAYQGAAALQEGEYSNAYDFMDIPFHSSCGAGVPFSYFLGHIRGGGIYWGSNCHFTAEQLVGAFADHLAALLEEAQSENARLQAQVGGLEARVAALTKDLSESNDHVAELRAVIREAAQAVWATRRFIRDRRFACIRERLEAAL